MARALRELPMIDTSFELGEISYSKVRAMTRAATSENEAQLLNIARHGTADTPAPTTAADRLEQLQAEHRRRGVEIDKSTAVTRWAGERMDYSTAIEWLMNKDGVAI